MLLSVHCATTKEKIIPSVTGALESVIKLRSGC